MNDRLAPTILNVFSRKGKIGVLFSIHSQPRQSCFGTRPKVFTNSNVMKRYCYLVHPCTKSWPSGETTITGGDQEVIESIS
jgi:hypothetical protein